MSATFFVATFLWEIPNAGTRPAHRAAATAVRSADSAAAGKDDAPRGAGHPGAVPCARGQPDARRALDVVGRLSARPPCDAAVARARGGDRPRVRALRVRI